VTLPVRLPAPRAAAALLEILKAFLKARRAGTIAASNIYIFVKSITIVYISAYLLKVGNYSVKAD
jgi:hypothetical protein